MIDGETPHELRSHHAAAGRLLDPNGIANFAIESIIIPDDREFTAIEEKAASSGVVVVSLQYDISEDEPRLERVWLIVPSAEKYASGRSKRVTLVPECRIWAPSDELPLVIVAPREIGGYFAASSDGTNLLHFAGLPADDLSAGIRRAWDRIASTARAIRETHERTRDGSVPPTAV
ncbi:MULTISPECIES: hypothetical protein [Sphingomonas]|uniref:hypothetical protein n=1 Tax=Sphingomonas TaxID=13687 RepID=UPI002FDF5A9E